MWTVPTRARNRQRCGLEESCRRTGRPPHQPRRGIRSRSGAEDGFHPPGLSCTASTGTGSWRSRSTDGFEYEGRRYGSLSAVARAATGTRWNFAHRYFARAMPA
ncbi:MAG: DUF2924 domain-containing protein [Bryobacteraceae bacterium]